MGCKATGKIIRSAFLFFIVVIFFLSFMHIFTVKAQETIPYIEVSVDKDYYLRGDTITLLCLSSEPYYHLQVYKPIGELWLNKTLQSNVTYTYTVPTDAVYGTYTVIASTGNAQTTTQFTVVDTLNLTFQPLPYKVSHKGITYIFYANWTVKVVGKTGQFTLNFTLFKMLAEKFDLKVEVRRNNMIFRVAISDPFKLVDLQFIWVFIHKGCKFVIKGKLPNSMTFPIKLQRVSSLKRLMHQVRCGNLVFDWSDLARARHTFYYDRERRALWITVPKNFVLDPYIFEDGFESGDFSAWTGTNTLNGNIEVGTTYVYQGSYAAHASLTQTNDWEYARCYKDISPQTTVFARAYFYIVTMPSTYYLKIILLKNTAYGYETLAVRVNDEHYLEIEYRNNGSMHLDTSTTQLNVNTWYCIEAKVVVDDTNGEVRVYLDGSEVTDLTHTGLNNSDLGGINRVYFGIAAAYNSPGELWFDEAVINDEYIGPLATNSAPIIGGIEAPSTVYANQYFNLNCTVRDGDGAGNIKNVTLHLGNGVVLKWDNDTNSFAESQDTNNYCTLNASACAKTNINSTTFKLSFNLKLNNYPAGTVSVTGTVYDSAGANGTKTESNLFTLNYPTLTLQARDANGNNLPLTVTFKGTLGNGTSFTANSNSNGQKQLTTCYGSHTINVWWGTHLIGTATTSVTSSKTVSIDTKIRKATFGSDYLLASLNNTDLPAPTVISGTEVKFAGVTASGTIQLKLDVSHWHVQDEPVKVQVGDYLYERGAIGWSWDSNNKIWSFNIHFSTQDIIIYWEETTTSDGGGSSGGVSTTTQIPAEPETEETATPTVPAQPTIPESYVIYKSPFTVDTTMVAVGLIVICVVVYLANHYLSNYGSVSKLWRKRLQRKRKVKWKR